MQNLTLPCAECGVVNSIDYHGELGAVSCVECQCELNDSFPLDVDDEQCMSYINHSSVPLLLDFYSSFCGPCMAMYDDYEDAALIMDMKVKFLKINTDHHQQTAKHFGISGVPCIIAIKNSQEVERVSRALTQTELTMWAEGLL